MQVATGVELHRRRAGHAFAQSLYERLRLHRCQHQGLERQVPGLCSRRRRLQHEERLLWQPVMQRRDLRAAHVCPLR